MRGQDECYHHSLLSFLYIGWFPSLIENKAPSRLVKLCMSSDKWTALGAAVTLSVMVQQSRGGTMGALGEDDRRMLESLRKISPYRNVRQEMGFILQQ